LLKIHYYFKKKGAVCLVFLHGLGGGLDVWNFMEKDVLAKGFSFLSIDLRGHGLSSSVNKVFKMAVFSQDVKKIINKEKIKKLILISHCFGGMVALEYAAHFPENIKALILIASNSKLPLKSKLIFPLLFLLKKLNIKKRNNIVDFRQFKGTKDISLKRFISDIKHMGSFSYSNIFQEVCRWKMSKKLRTLTCPVLVIAGKKDHFFSVASQKKLVENFYNSQLVLLNTNHMIPINKPKEMKQIIFYWLKKKKLL